MHSYMKNLFLSFLVLFFFVAAQAQLANKPPMGWNSYNCFGSAVLEKEVKANADYMAVNLKQFGWEYVVVDFLWSYDNPPTSKIGNPGQLRLNDGSFLPWLAMDAYGRLLPHVNKFPSAFQANGFKALSDYIHSKGLKFGIHVMRGIPRQAVWSKTPVLGAAGVSADMIADTASVCKWLNHMYGLNMSKPGAQEYLNSIVQLYASWDVDFLKVDDLSRPYSDAEVAGYQKAIQASGRPMVLSLSPGETPRSAADHAVKNANMWRMADDFWDEWKEMLKMFDYAKNWEGVSGPGHWPDCDMLTIGKLSKRGPVGKERYSRFNEAELYTHMSFWALFRSPLMLGGNLPENREIEVKLFSNPEVLAVNQQGENPKQILKQDGSMIWVSNVAGSKDLYVGLFNISDADKNISLDFASLGIKTKTGVRDLWLQKDLGVFAKQFQQTIPAHGVALVRLQVK